MKREQIETMLKRYLDGDSTEKEERQLRKFFLQPNLVIPDEWQPYRALFNWETENVTKFTFRHKQRFLQVASLAATILVAVLLLFHHLGTDDYVIHDGRKITDQAVVYQDAEEALQMVSADKEEDFCALSAIGGEYENE